MLKEMLGELSTKILRFDITKRLVLLVGVVLFIFSLAIGVFSYFKTTSVMYGEIRFWTYRIASQIADKGVFGVVLEDSFSLAKQLEVLKKDPDVLKAQFFSSKGVLLAQIGNYGVEMPFRLIDKPYSRVVRGEGKKALMVEYPIISTDEKGERKAAGVFRLFYSLQRIDHLVYDVFLKGFSVVMSAFLFCAVIAYFFARVQISNPVRNAVDVISSSSQEINSTVMEFRAGTSQQASSVQELTTASEEIASAAKQISEKASSVEKAARETFSVVESSRDEVNELINEIYEIKKKIEELASSILELTDMSKRITGITGLIEDISEQTNLLAVNAAIEAAGAGEAGRRFSVVAAEIRNLAARTREATDDIRKIISEIQVTTSRTVIATETGVRSFDEVVTVLGKITTIFDEINRAASSAVDVAQEISLSTKQQVA